MLQILHSFHNFLNNVCLPQRSYEILISTSLLDNSYALSELASRTFAAEQVGEMDFSQYITHLSQHIYVFTLSVLMMISSLECTMSTRPNPLTCRYRGQGLMGFHPSNDRSDGIVNWVYQPRWTCAMHKCYLLGSLTNSLGGI